MGVITISCGSFESCCINKKTPPQHFNLSFVTLRNRRPTLLRTSVNRTPSEVSPWRRCGHASQSEQAPARDSRAPPVEGGADGCDARALSAQPTAMKSLQIRELP